MDDKHKKTVRMEIRLTARTAGQIDELARIIAGKLGTPVTRTKAIEIATNFLLDQFVKYPD